jgi:hypothetical protein
MRRLVAIVEKMESTTIQPRNLNGHHQPAKSP